MNLLELMENRRSIRKYNEKNITDEKLEQVLKAALLSASGKAIRPWEFIIIKDKKRLNLLAECKKGAKFINEGNAVIAVLADTTKSDTWIEDCSIAMTNMQLMASFLELGSCWIQIRSRQNEAGEDSESCARKILKFPENYKLLALLVLGETDHKLNPNKVTDELLKKIHYEIF
ncbi:MAG: nitroreductase family protein [Fusobacterium sp.]|uniref:nitroreductase family protein n=1 Tax=Fusobacterium sp. TaxID=68766 RepID=UPI0026DC04E0|nr:nitroreductase family protein [Fusobacterium sp.]MDO4690099.1 nitroreductase family protein [Fusobacterium sp.]